MWLYYIMVMSWQTEVPFSCLFVLLCLTALLHGAIAMQSPSHPRVRGLLTYRGRVQVSVRHRPAFFQGDVILIAHVCQI